MGVMLGAGVRGGVGGRIGMVVVLCNIYGLVGVVVFVCIICA
jgi:hypothetical protein